MENTNINQEVLAAMPAPSSNGIDKVSSRLPFIEANTTEVKLDELQDEHIIPVFSATNEPLISHQEIVETIYSAVQNWYQGETILKPSIRVSHPVKGRIPEARHKRANELLPHEQTLFYERMAFVLRIPTVSASIAGQKMSLVIGGVKSYNKDNLYGKRPNGEQHLQLFIGFQVSCCCNLCVSTDGLKVYSSLKSLEDLDLAVEQLLRGFDMKKDYQFLRHLDEVGLTQSEFAKVIGKARMYKHLPESDRPGIFPVDFGDQQMGSVVKGFYNDENFKASDSSINMWEFYNLLTEANKSSYIDSFLQRSVNATGLVKELVMHKRGEKKSWYLE